MLAYLPSGGQCLKPGCGHLVTFPGLVPLSTADSTTTRERPGEGGSVCPTHVPSCYFNCLLMLIIFSTTGISRSSGRIYIKPIRGG